MKTSEERISRTDFLENQLIVEEQFAHDQEIQSTDPKEGENANDSFINFIENSDIDPLIKTSKIEGKKRQSKDIKTVDVDLSQSCSGDYKSLRSLR